MNPKRLLSIFVERLPLVISVCDHDTPSVGERLSKRWLFSERFGSCINKRCSRSGLLYPRWHQSPTGILELNRCVGRMTLCDQNRLRRCDVIARPDRWKLGWKILAEQVEKPLSQGRFKGKTTAQVSRPFDCGGRCPIELTFEEHRSNEPILDQNDLRIR